MAQPDPNGRRTTSLARRGTTTPAKPDERPSTIGLFKEALGETVDVLQAHVELAVLEVREDAQAAVRIGVGFGIGAALGFVAIGLLSAAAVLGLAVVMPAWAAALAVGGAYAVAAAIYISVARKRLRSHDFRPEATIAALEEDAKWISEKVS